MGITGLLPLLKSIQRPGNLKKYNGQTIGVDAYGWLHRGTAGCAIELAQGKPTTMFVDFAMHRVRMLVHFGITPYIVFDGDYLPSKAGTEKDRCARRKEGKRLGLELLRMGKTAQAHFELQKAVDVTPEMARMLIEELKRNNIQYIVAPYEADSQLAYLERKGIIKGVLSEDSDLLVFGVKCLITKLDKYGECVEVNRNLFTACREISLTGWTDADFRRMAILSGCDYLPGIGGMGLKTAYRMLRKHKSVPRLVQAAQFDGKLKVASDYLKAFDQAEATFLYQWVFCPQANQLVNLSPPPADLDITTMHFIGEKTAAPVARGVACGDLHPHSKLPLAMPVTSGKRAWPLRTPRSSLQTPDEKPSKSIDSFFKPQRTPLTELDINLFNPSPSQQSLLEHNVTSRGWIAVPVPQGSPHSRRTAPQPSRRVLTEPAALTRSVPRPNKRQRLCSDVIHVDTAPESDEATTSRFFSASQVAQSPSLHSTGARRRKSSKEFDLFSENPVELALSKFNKSASTSVKSSQKMSIFNDSFNPSTQEDTQSSIFSNPKSIFSPSTQPCDSQSPATSPEPDSQAAVDGSPHIFSLRSAISYTSTDSAISRPRNQHSKKSALAQEGTLNKRQLAALGAPTQDSQQDGALSNPTVSSFKPVVVAASSCADPTASRSADALVPEIRGSEELLVPDSDEESISSPRKPMISLRRFAYGT